MKLTQRILIGMVAGIVLGVLVNLLSGVSWAPQSIIIFVENNIVGGVLDAIGRIFVASLKLLVVPLVFVSLVLGSQSLGNHSRMGPMAVKTILLYLVTTAIAVSLALLLATLVQPGNGIELQSDAVFDPAAAPSLKDVVVDIFPTNPVEAMANGNMLQIIVFSILMGVALARAGDSASSVLSFFEGFQEVIMRMVLILMHFAPYGVFALLAKLFSELGVSAIVDLGKYFATVVAVLLIHAILVYGSFVRFFTGLSPLRFFLNVRPAMIFAFSTASSSATLPVTMGVAQRRVGVDNSIASFTIPLGATINMDGTAIMQGVATAFIAQAFGYDIGITGYLAVIATATLASIGTAGVPGVGLITLAMVLQQVGLPVEGIAMIIGVDRLLDMIRTAVNVTGDSMVASLVANSEGLLDKETFNDVSDTDEAAEMVR